MAAIAEATSANINPINNKPEETMDQTDDTPSDTEAAVSRRRFLAGSAVATAIVVANGAVMHPGEAWGYEAKALTPDTIRTLIKMARDIYPHDRLADRYYAIAIKAHDEAAAKDPAVKAVIETGIAKLDELAKAKHKVGYAQVGWEDDRVALLHKIEPGPLFKRLRGGLVTGLYNNKEVWPIFGYEGESASKGGYINRGFNDLTWL